jgi:D-alanyl-D-alanine carboxypeptidase
MAVAAKARKRLNRRVIAFILHTTEPQQANKVKNYGQTIQQSRKPETPEQLSQTQKGGGQGQKSRRKKTGLTGRFEVIEKAAHPGGLFVLAWQPITEYPGAIKT